MGFTTNTILSILSDLREIRDQRTRAPENRSADRIIRRLQEVLNATRELAVPVTASVMRFTSPMRRATETASRSALTMRAAKTSISITEVELLREINLDRTLSEQELERFNTTSHVNLDILCEELGLNGLIEDTPKNRRLLTDIDHVFPEGESILGYGQRILPTFTAVLLHASATDNHINIDPDGIRKIAEQLPVPTKAHIQHILNVQDNVASGKGLVGAFDASCVYEPLARALDELPEGTRAAMSRHGDTPLSQRKRFTGGHMDVRLTSQGQFAAIQTGFLLTLFNSVKPANGKHLDITGHSGVSALCEAAICAMYPRVHQTTKGAYAVGQPHIIDIKPDGVVISELTLKSLEEMVKAMAREKEGIIPAKDMELV